MMLVEEGKRKPRIPCSRACRPIRRRHWADLPKVLERRQAPERRDQGQRRLCAVLGTDGKGGDEDRAVDFCIAPSPLGGSAHRITTTAEDRCQFDQEQGD